MLQRILDEGYIKVDYEIDFPYEEFTNEVFRDTEYSEIRIFENVDNFENWNFENV